MRDVVVEVQPAIVRIRVDLAYMKCKPSYGIGNIIGRRTDEDRDDHGAVIEGVA